MSVRKICPCETGVDEPGPHIPECPWSDPDYEPGIPIEVARVRNRETEARVDAIHELHERGINSPQEAAARIAELERARDEVECRRHSLHEAALQLSEREDNLLKRAESAESRVAALLVEVTRLGREVGDANQRANRAIAQVRCNDLSVAIERQCVAERERDHAFADRDSARTALAAMSARVEKLELALRPLVKLAEDFADTWMRMFYGENVHEELRKGNRIEVFNVIDEHIANGRAALSAATQEGAKTSGETHVIADPNCPPEAVGALVDLTKRAYEATCPQCGNAVTDPVHRGWGPCGTGKTPGDGSG